MRPRVGHKVRFLPGAVNEKYRYIEKTARLPDGFGGRRQELVQLQRGCEVLGKFIDELDLRDAPLRVVDHRVVLEGDGHLGGEELGEHNVPLPVRRALLRGDPQRPDRLIPRPQGDHEQCPHSGSPELRLGDTFPGRAGFTGRIPAGLGQIDAEGRLVHYDGARDSRGGGVTHPFLERGLLRRRQGDDCVFGMEIVEDAREADAVRENPPDLVPQDTHDLVPAPCGVDLESDLVQRADSAGETVRGNDRRAALRRRKLLRRGDPGQRRVGWTLLILVCHCLLREDCARNVRSNGRSRKPRDCRWRHR